VRRIHIVSRRSSVVSIKKERSSFLRCRCLLLESFSASAHFFLLTPEATIAGFSGTLFFFLRRRPPPPAAPPPLPLFSVRDSVQVNAHPPFLHDQAASLTIDFSPFFLALLADMGALAEEVLSPGRSPSPPPFFFSGFQVGAPPLSFAAHRRVHLVDLPFLARANAGSKDLMVHLFPLFSSCADGIGP